MSALFCRAPGPAARKAITIVTVLSGALLVGAWALPSGAEPQMGPAKQSNEVIVANDATRPVPVTPQGTTQVAGAVTTTQAGELLQFEKLVRVSPDSPGVFLADAGFDVPEGKRLVVEHVTGAITLHPEGSLQIRVGSASQLHYLPFQHDPNSDGRSTFAERASTSQAMTFFVDDAGPGANEVKIQILREGPAIDAAAPQIITFVGRLFDR